MKQLFLLITLFCFASSDYINLTSNDLKAIANKPFKKSILLRFKEYEDVKNKVKDYDTLRKLGYLNSFFNRILPMRDQLKYKSDDHWSTPKQFIIEGRGDCEEYAISKYFALQEVGIDPKKLFLAVVKVKNRKNSHMVLLYFQTIKSMPVVLDNLSFKVLPFDKRVDLTPVVIFNETNSYLMKNKKIDKKVKIDWNGDNKWENLLNQVKDGK